MASPIYFDHHSTTPCAPAVIEKMLPFFGERFGNPSAISHASGRDAAAAVESARQSMAELLDVSPSEIFFTSSATESNNIVLQQLQAEREGVHLITSAIEHKSVLAPAKQIARAGVEVTILSVDAEGFVNPEDVARGISAHTRLVSIMAANADVGTLQDVEEISKVCAAKNVLFHSDITQAIGKVPLKTSKGAAVSFSLSAHKFYGPKGVGALIFPQGRRRVPLFGGGGQERGMRSGTLNVPGIVGMAAALEASYSSMDAEMARLTALRNELWDALAAAIPDITFNGPRRQRLPGNLSVSFNGVDIEALMHTMRDFSLSTGAACSSGDSEPSYVLLAMGVSVPRATSSLRIGLGTSNTTEEATKFVKDLKRSLERVRGISAF